MKQSASPLAPLMPTVPAGPQMDGGLPSYLIVKANPWGRMKRSRRSGEKANPRSGLSQPMEVRRVNSPLRSMVLLILSGHPIVNAWCLMRRSARQTKKPKMANHCPKSIDDTHFGQWFAIFGFFVCRADLRIKHQAFTIG